MSYLEYQGQRYHYVWLRDHCHCADCLHPSGQRLIDAGHLDLTVQPEIVESDEQGLKITWQDGHQSEWTAAFLTQNAYDTYQAPVTHKAYWGSELDLSVLSFDYAAIQRDLQVKHDWLQAVDTYGLAIVNNVPTQSEQLLDVVKLFGFVRDTNYGRFFEVITKHAPENLAYTPLALSLHTDNPYRNPVPSLQLLHCLKAAEQGGTTALADGFYAAELLRQQYPDSFELLSQTEVDFAFESEEASLFHRSPIFTLDQQKNVKEVRFNNRSIAPLNLPFEQMETFYQAYQQYSQCLQASRVRFKLEAGQLMIFDNVRILHGREDLAIGERHLQGCYADSDGLLSTLRLLKKSLA